MTDSPAPRHPRRTTAIIVAVLVLVIAAVVVIGLLAASGAPVASPTSSAPTEVVTTPTVAPSSASTSPTPTPTTSVTPTAPATAPTPQATKTTSLSSTAPIEKRLTAAVTKSVAVQGTAQGPGEIAGPAVRFTITITNTTGKAVDLSNTVVNAYYGKQGTPANELESPGGAPFPQSVANGKTVQGVFIFTVPKTQRSDVVVTVDTSVDNPVVAFRGSAPQ